ncbi:hypothetical protein B0I35DRAFT_442809 [Stachybotrys elegans]|uniref:Secreted protein n=1 Tax=Stachybotrys elegans TaxID=80388 RepID=A0A8K0SKH8_9HYPO|nr:hypothetical protein B0I35DRAFT_442809 [Stachybotrys elegans]
MEALQKRFCIWMVFLCCAFLYSSACGDHDLLFLLLPLAPPCVFSCLLEGAVLIPELLQTYACVCTYPSAFLPFWGRESRLLWIFSWS